MLQALRDKEDWPLPSYFLKVVAVWMVKKYPKEDFWKNQDLGSLFLLVSKVFNCFKLFACLKMLVVDSPLIRVFLYQTDKLERHRVDLKSHSNAESKMLQLQTVAKNAGKMN